MALDATTYINGASSVDNVEAEVTTNNPWGYTLLISSNDSDMIGDNGSIITGVGTTTDFINGSGTVLYPADLSTNSWGFAIPKDQTGNLPNGFADSYTTQQSGLSPAGVFAKVPTNPVTIKRVSSDITQDTTEIYFGVRTDMFLATGTYSNTVTFTAIGIDEFIGQDIVVDYDQSSMLPVYYGAFTCSARELEDDDECKNSDTETWRIANPYEYNNNHYDGDDTDESWYSYDDSSDKDDEDDDSPDKRWANAVLITSNPTIRSAYFEAPPGTPVSETDITAYFVYIPRYRYRVQALDYASAPTSPQLYEIQFENRYLPGYARATIGSVSAVGDWLTHPAFTVDPDGYPTDNSDDEIELNGFWIGKFELTGTVAAPTTKPNIASLATSVNDIWLSAGNMAGAYGLDVNNYEIQPQNNYHWGATAQLAVSKYGQGETEISYNLTNATTGAGNYVTNVNQSTTGNITGVYDMVRGRWEYTLANYGAKGAGNVSSSDLPNFPIIPGLGHLNIIPFTGPATCTFEVCVGQALIEQGNGYWDATYSTAWKNNGMTAASSWLVRGGCFYNGSNTGGSLFSVEARVGSSAAVGCFGGDSGATSPGGRVVESKITD
jgi:hypothetical protein